MDETELLELLALELRGSSASSRSLAETLGGPQLQPYENEAKEEGEKPWDPLASVSEDEQKAELFESLIQDIRTLNEHLQMHQFGELDEDEVGRLGKNLVRSLDRAGALIERVERRWWWFNRRMGKDYRRRMNSYLGCMKSVFQHQANLASLGEKEGFFAAVDVVKSPAWKMCFMRLLESFRETSTQSSTLNYALGIWARSTARMKTVWPPAPMKPAWI